MASVGMTDEDRAAIDRFEREVVQPSMTRLVIVDFWATWCGPCKQLTPILDKLATEYAGKGVLLAKIDVDQDKLIAAQFRIQSVPTVYAIFQGQPVADLTQYRTEGQLRQMLDRLLAEFPVQGEAQSLQAQIEPLVAMGEEVLGQGDSPRAVSIFRQIHDMAPADPAVIGGLARALTAAGELTEAGALLDSAPAEAGGDAAIARARAALDVAAAAPAVDVAEIEARLARDPDDHQARFELAGARMAAGDRDGAADALLAIIARDRDWNDGAARARLLMLVEAAGIADPWARAQRRRLSALLFT